MASAANLNGEADSPKASDSSAIERPAPVALEVSVNATGARPTRGDAPRELFSEDTSTVLVFQDGAVIRLSAAVIQGQLLFLTHKDTNREVVCQVVRKRAFRPTTSYVELQFTEPQDDFWGVKFDVPASAATSVSSDAPTAPPAPVSEEVAEAHEMVQSSEPAEDDAGVPTEAPSNEEVALLRSEVEALREQLRSLQSKPKEVAPEPDFLPPPPVQAVAPPPPAPLPASDPVPVPPSSPEPETSAAPSPPASAPSIIRMSLPASPAATSAPPAAPATEEPPPAHVPDDAAAVPWPKDMTAGMAVEPESHSAAREAMEELLPEPALDFSKAPAARPEGYDFDSIYKPLRKPLPKWIPFVLVFFILGGIAGAAWHLKLLPTTWPWKNAVAPAAVRHPVQPHPANATPAANPSTAPAGNANTAATTTPAPATATSSNPAATPAPATSTTSQPAAATPAASNPPAASTPSPAVSTPAPTAPVQPSATAPSSAKPSAASAPPKESARASRSKKGTPAPAVAAQPVVIPEDAPVIPPKLEHAVQPVYPPDAMRNFITGDVRLSAVVDAKGHVTSIEVISGPAALRQAAIDAMKQYEYSPATKGGHPVDSKVTTTIKFWYNP